MRGRTNILGILIDTTDLGGAERQLERFVVSGRPHQIVTVNLDFVSIALRDPGFKELVNSADLAVADGMPLVWASRFLGSPLRERVTGVDLAHRCAQIAARNGHSIFLLGGEAGVARRAAEVLGETYEGLKIAGAYSPPVGDWSRQEDEKIVRMIRGCRPEFLFVGLGCPKQDFWIQRHKDELGVPVSIGVGCVFDLLSGRSKRAPEWMQSSGLEWLYRLIQEPRRLWRRYLINDVPTLFRVMAWRFQANGMRASDSRARSGTGFSPRRG